MMLSSRTEESALRFADCAFIPIDLAPRRWQVITARRIIVYQGRVNALCLTFQNWTFPYTGQNNISDFLTRSQDDIFNHVNLLAVRKQRCKLLVRSLEDAKCGIHRTIDDQDIFHRSGQATPLQCTFSTVSDLGL